MPLCSLNGTYIAAAARSHDSASPGRASLLEAATDPDEAIAEGETGLGPLSELCRIPGLDQAPFVGRVNMLRRQRDRVLEHGRAGQRAAVATARSLLSSAGAGSGLCASFAG